MNSRIGFENSNKLQAIGGIFSLTVGCFVLLGWAFDIKFLKSVALGFVTMKPNTAFCFLLSGIALLFLKENLYTGDLKRRIVQICAISLLLIGLFTLAEYIFNLNFGFDRLLFSRPLSLDDDVFPGRMSPISAFNFSVLGIIFLIRNVKIREKFYPAQWLSLIIALTSLTAIAGYAYNVQVLHLASHFASIALHSAVTFFVVSVCLLFADGNHGIVAVYFRNSAGGKLMRRMIPAAVFVPLFLGWLRLKGEYAGYYNMEFGLALFATSNVLVFSFLVWRSAFWLDKTDTERELAETKSVKLASIVESSDDAIISKNFDGTILSWNKGAEQVFGYAADEVIGRNITILFPPELLAEEQEILAKIRRGEQIEHYETVRRRKDGSDVKISLTVSPVRNDAGEIVGVSKIARDITEQKRAEEIIKDSEAHLRRVLDNLFAFVGVLLPDGTLVDCNRAPLEAAGVKPDEVFGKKVWETVWVNHDVEVQRQMREDCAGAAQGKIIRHDIDLQIFGGNIITVDFMIAPMRDNNGGITNLIASAVDITDRKRTAETLRESETRYRTLFESIDEGFSLIEVLFDENEKAHDYRFLEINPAFEILTGIPVEAALSATSVRKLIPDLEEKWFYIYGQVALTGEPIRFVEKSEALGNWFDVYAFRVGEPECRRVSIIFKNVTEQKNAEKHLRLSEERYRLLFENNPYPMWVYDLQTLNFLAVNESVVKQYGYSQEEFLSMTIKDIRPEEDVPDLLKDVAETKKQLNNAGVWKHRKKDGTIIYVEINSHELTLDGKRSRLVLINDITESKLAEAALREKEEQLYATDRQLADIVHGMTEACFAIDDEWRFTFINYQGETLLRHSREEMLGESLWEVFDNIAGTPMEKNYRRTMTERVPVAFEVFSLSAKRWLDVRLFPSGNGLAAFLLDIHERKMLEADRQKFVSLAENSIEFVGMWDLKGISFFINEAGWKLVGLNSSDDVLKTHLSDFFFPEDHEFIFGNFLPKAQLLGHAEVEIRFRHFKSGQAIWMLYHVFVVKDEYKQPVGFATVSRDITERKKYEQEFIQLNESLEQKVVERTTELNSVNKELEAFSYSVSHDLRAPLRAMDGFSLALLEDYAGKLDATGQNYLNRVRSASKQMAQLIDDMLMLSQVTRSEIVKTNVNLSKIARSIADELQENQPRENTIFDIEENCWIYGDNRLLRIALENLLGNAYKFTSKQTTAKIIFGCHQNDGVNEYFVKDNGVGFEMAYAEKLFGAFQRLHSTVEFEGTGIGLATVQRVVRRHGGSTRAEGKVGEGASFYFTL